MAARPTGQHLELEHPQALDGFVTVSGTLAGTITLGHGTPAPLMPFLWVVLLLIGDPREARPSATAAAVR